jgi:hypothetical protein
MGNLAVGIVQITVETGSAGTKVHAGWLLSPVQPILAKRTFLYLLGKMRQSINVTCLKPLVIGGLFLIECPGLIGTSRDAKFTANALVCVD